MESKLDSTHLADAKSYREFIAFALGKMVSGKKPNLSAISRRAGFSSRSFIREVIVGKKSLTENSTNRISSALKLTALQRIFFQLLVKSDHPELSFGFTFKEPINVRIESCRKKLRSQEGRKKSELKNLDNLFQDGRRLQIYAALGSIEEGASLEDVCRRTKFGAEEVKILLDSLVKNGIVEFRNSRYFTFTNHAASNKLASNIDFKNVFIDSLAAIKKSASENFSSDTEHFFHSALSVKESKLVELKKALRETVLDFVDGAYDDDGEKIAKITVALYF